MWQPAGLLSQWRLNSELFNFQQSCIVLTYLMKIANSVATLLETNQPDRYLKVLLLETWKHFKILDFLDFVRSSIVRFALLLEAILNLFIFFI